MRSYVLTIDHIHPAKRPITRRLYGTAREVTKQAAETLRTLAARQGISPLAMSFNMEIAR